MSLKGKTLTRMSQCSTCTALSLPLHIRLVEKDIGILPRRILFPSLASLGISFTLFDELLQSAEINAILISQSQHHAGLHNEG